ncbi:MAG: RdgB/HAM1 family non-canonical purine NTP pyrophosphatase [Aeriscardovia sp.]|nr:RdgB/HAM1 family non-canonical purine NTP pyrophosphatase [Aeriscardovia sp.]
MNTTIVLATHNEGKVSELKQMVAERIICPTNHTITIISAKELGIPDPVEDGTTFEENALLKARFVAQRTGYISIADDSGLIVDILGKAPGILSARWSGQHGNDHANMDLLLAQLEDIPDNGRTAHFECCAALIDPQHSREKVEYGRMNGHLAHTPRGTQGFGYDPIFIPDEQPTQNTTSACILWDTKPLTCAQLSADQKNQISHRGHAMRALLDDLQDMLFN